MQRAGPSTGDDPRRPNNMDNGGYNLDDGYRHYHPESSSHSHGFHRTSIDNQEPPPPPQPQPSSTRPRARKRTRQPHANDPPSPVSLPSAASNGKSRANGNGNGNVGSPQTPAGPSAPPAVLVREKKQKACSNCRRAKLKCLVEDGETVCVRCNSRKDACIFYPRGHVSRCRGPDLGGTDEL
jgi:hypothetical protein